MLGEDTARAEVGQGLVVGGLNEEAGPVDGWYFARSGPCGEVEGGLYFSRVPVAEAVHAQGLLGRVPALWQRGHLLALLLQVPNGFPCHGQLLLFCLRGPGQQGARG